MKPTETNRVLRESTRRAAVQASSAVATSGPQSSAGVAATGVDGSGNVIPYGRVGVTPIGEFRVRGA